MTGEPQKIHMKNQERKGVYGAMRWNRDFILSYWENVACSAKRNIGDDNKGNYMEVTMVAGTKLRRRTCSLV